MPLKNSLEFRLYTSNEYSQFISEHAGKVNSIAANLLSHKSTNYIENVETEVVTVSLGDEIWPVSVNNTEYSNALTCSPYTTYITYPLDMYGKFKAPWVKVALVLNSIFVSAVCRLCHVNQVMQVNNTFDSLLKHPELFCERLQQLNKLLLKKYPKHAILFFRVNQRLDAKLLDSLKANDYLVFPDRAAHVFDPVNQFIKRSRVKKDIAQLEKSEYQVVQQGELTRQDVIRICELYNDLFVGKHSKHNPHFTEQYFIDAVNNHWHHYVALRNPEGIIDAFISWYIKDGIMICGPIGYDTSVDVTVGLYRMSVVLALQYANQHNYVFNMGAGSDEFKRDRGSQRVLEYTAVYVKHLPFYRHLPWRLLQFACNTVVPRIFAKESL